MARAKRTDRTEARRRYRAEQAALRRPRDRPAARRRPPRRRRRRRAPGARARPGRAPAPASWPRSGPPSVRSTCAATCAPLPRSSATGAPASAAVAIVGRRRVHHRRPTTSSPRSTSRSRQPLAGKIDRHRLEPLVPRDQHVRHPAARRRRVPDRLHRQARELARRPGLRRRRGRSATSRSCSSPAGTPADRRHVRGRRTSRRPRCPGPGRRRAVRLRGRVVPPVPGPREPEPRPPRPQQGRSSPARRIARSSRAPPPAPLTHGARSSTGRPSDLRGRELGRPRPAGPVGVDDRLARARRIPACPAAGRPSGDSGPPAVPSPPRPAARPRAR